jgi:hypothetical protein
MPGMLLLNALIYLVVVLGWSGVVRTLVVRSGGPAQRFGCGHSLLAVVLALAPFCLAPFYIPPPEARVRGDPQRIAINARREVSGYGDLSRVPIWRVALEDVRPRPDGSPGMRVCLRAYTLFYWPIGSVWLDMTPEGVRSTRAGLEPLNRTCWS